MKGRISHFGLAMLTAGVLALLVAACGSSNSSSSTSSGAAASTSSSTSSAATSASNFKVGLVTDIGGLNDHGFNHLAYLGLQDAISQLGVKGTVLQSTSGADYVPNLSTFAREGYNLVISVGFLMADATAQVAKAYPKVHFAIIDNPVGGAANAPDDLPNMEGLLFAEQQPGYLVGYLSGLYAKSKGYTTISSVGGESIPPVTDYIAGFQQGAKAADPSIKLLNAYSQNFTDESSCEHLALNQIAAGSKVVFQVAGACGLGVISAGVAKHVQVIGVDADQSYLAPTWVLSSAEKRVDLSVLDATKDLLHGEFASDSNLQFNMTNGGVGYGKIDAAGAPFAATIANIAAQMKAGKIVPTTTVAVNG